MEDPDLNKRLDAIFGSIDPPKAQRVSLESILSRLPSEGQAWLNSLNPFCRWAIAYDLRAEPDAFVKYWEYLRDILQKLEHDFGPSDNWKQLQPQHRPARATIKVKTSWCPVGLHLERVQCRRDEGHKRSIVYCFAMTAPSLPGGAFLPLRGRS